VNDRAMAEEWGGLCTFLSLSFDSNKLVHVEGSSTSISFRIKDLPLRCMIT